MKRTPCVHLLIIISFLINSVSPVSFAQANPAFGGAGELRLPVPGVMVQLSPEFNPSILKGVTIHPEDPFKFDFILDKNNNTPSIQESSKLVKYFLASITTPENDLWVNLSPYEKNRIIPDSFGQTDMGRDLLGEDYILKQVTASLIYPEGEVGKQFWKRIYSEAAKRYGTTNIPVNTFNKVWIVPDHAKVYVHGNTAFVVNAKLKVMLEEDYLALEKNSPTRGHVPLTEGKGYVSPSTLPTDPGSSARAPQGNPPSTNELGSQVVREIVIPQLTKEVNEGKNFSTLRQVYYSLILAVWFKKHMKNNILGRKYMDQNKVSDLSSPNDLIGDPDVIYQRYLKAFKKGVFNYIKEEPIFPHSGGEGQGGETIPRKYFSGGFEGNFAMNSYEETTNVSPQEAQVTDGAKLTVKLGSTDAKVNLKKIEINIKYSLKISKEIVDDKFFDNLTKKRGQR
jgi:hypothetical protein